jgi:myo-inositol-1(or 4)-monophosphatase
LLDAPARGEFWMATAGRGATRNGLPLVASTRTEFVGSRIPTDSLPEIDRDLVMVDKPNSIALRIAMVAADEADILATLRWGFEWDIAAACLIAREAERRSPMPLANRSASTSAIRALSACW